MADFSTLYDYVRSETTLPDPYGEQDSSQSLKWEDHADYALEFKKYEVYGHKDQIYLKTWSGTIIPAVQEVLNKVDSRESNYDMGNIGHFVRSFINKNLVSKYGKQEYMHKSLAAKDSIWHEDGIAFLEQMLKPFPIAISVDGMSSGDMVNCFYAFYVNVYCYYNSFVCFWF